MWKQRVDIFAPCSLVTHNTSTPLLGVVLYILRSVAALLKCVFDRYNIIIECADHLGRSSLLRCYTILTHVYLSIPLPFSLLAFSGSTVSFPLLALT